MRWNIVQRRMLRSMIGWRRFTDEPWEETMRRMKRRMADALHHYPLSSWSERFHRNRWRYAIHVVNNEKNRLPFWIAQWVPLLDPISIYMPYRGPGRPRLRWDDQLHGRVLLCAFGTLSLAGYRTIFERRVSST